MRGAVPPLPQHVFNAWCLVKNRDNFTFTLTEATPICSVRRRITTRRGKGFKLSIPSHIDSDSSVSKLTGCGLHGRDSIPGWRGNFSSLSRCSVTLAASSLRSPPPPPPEAKRPKRETNRSPPPWMRGVLTLFPVYTFKLQCLGAGSALPLPIGISNLALQQKLRD
jgi:hypothetical protein